jgi:N-acetylmuramoyl-L-alanine amidase
MKRRVFVQSGTVVLCLGTSLVHGASIVNVRIWPAPDYSRVTIESDSPLQATQSMVNNPPRLAVDIAGISLNPALKELVAKVRQDDPNIAGIRVGQFSAWSLISSKACAPKFLTCRPSRPTNIAWC